ncbi:hypothetical protein [Legionella drozanskii]|uniref:Lipoprotein n=1 Tax=Legionella drozanskii LLAP-1 TaxID=1212489 RepID=A0A0W0SM57_9GAMM|nr:hypothetical protein [Legionella drozanskii]KTC84419.1 hypothetical protein Ldro_3022 [Legionella drozanskii LLAP-1]
MKKKILALSLISFAAFSANTLTPEQEKIEEQKRMKVLSELGLPLPGSGIKLVARTALDLSKEQLEKGAKAEEEMKTLGYAVVDTNRPIELLNFHNYSKTQFKLYAGNNRATSTHLRPQIKDLQLAFKFKGVPQGNALMAAGNITLLGVAPQGGFHEDKGGWSGAAQYFDAKSIGSCSYGVMNVNASNTAAELAIEDVTYSVNNKATIITVEGNKNSGFLYKVDWYDEKNFHELECANTKYSAETTTSVIALANQIDAYQ